MKKNNFNFKSRLEMITDIVARNELPLLDVLEIYTRFNYRVYKEHNKKNEKSTHYDLALEEKTYRLTERYFDIQRIKELNKCVIK